MSNEFILYNSRSFQAQAVLFAIRVSDGLILSLSAGHLKGIRCSRDAEGEALLRGLKMAEALKLAKVSIFADSVEVVNAVLFGTIKSHLPEYVSECSKKLRENKGWRLDHCPREDNIRADDIAKFARIHEWSWNIPDALPRIEAMAP